MGAERSKRDRENRVSVLSTKLLPERAGRVMRNVHISKKDGRNRGIGRAREQKRVAKITDYTTSLFDD